MGGVFVNATLHERPGYPPMRRVVEVPLAQLPGVNKLLLRLASELASLQEAVIEAPDPSYVSNLEALYLQRGLRISELEAELRERGVRLSVAIEELAEERRWREKSVLKRLLGAFSRKTTPKKLLGEGGSERSGPHQ